MSVFCIDFTPRLLEAELPYSTLSLTGLCGGPKYEAFSMLVDRASEWLGRHSDVHIVNVEVIEVSGVYAAGSSCAQSVRNVYQTALPAYLKVLRLWYKCGLSGGTKMALQLHYLHVIPARLESHPRAFNPKFQTLDVTLDLLNKQLSSGESVISGKLVSIQTSMFRFSSRHCHLDPERSFWMIGDANEVHVCYYFTAFYLKSASSVKSRLSLPIHELHYKDFASKYTTLSGEKKVSKNYEGVAELMERMRVWLDESSAAVINIQTVDHHAYYRSAIDAPGFEEKSLSNPHFRSSLSGLQHSAKVLRVYFCRCEACWREKSLARDDSSDHSVAHKSFHVTLRPVPCSQLDFSCSDVDLQIRLEQSVLSQMNEWIDSSGVKVLCAETMKVGTFDRRRRRSSADDTLFLSVSSATAGAVYAIRLYVLLRSESIKQVDLRPVPQYMRSRFFRCAIL